MTNKEEITSVEYKAEKAHAQTRRKTYLQSGNKQIPAADWRHKLRGSRHKIFVLIIMELEL